MGELLRNEHFLPSAILLAQSATSQIYISTFKAELTHKPRGRLLKKLFETLADKANHNCKVYFLMNWHQDKRGVAKTNLYAARWLKDRQVSVKFLRNNRCCHSKLLVIDKRRAIIGSHNLSVKSCHNNFEMSYLINDPGSVKEICVAFELAWQDGKKMDK